MTLLLCLLLILHSALRFHGLFLDWDLSSSASPKGVYSTSKVESISPEMTKLLQESPIQFWDCALPETPCRYFNPRQFFREEAQESQDDYKRLGGTNNNLPAMTALSWSGSAAGSIIALPQNMSFIHIHKCAGTTVKTLLAQTKQSLLKVDNTMAELNHYKYSSGGGSAAKKERNQLRRQAHIEGMAQLSPPTAVVFAFVRDPLERFLSAVQQVMHYNEEFRQKCLKWTARSTLRCAIDHIRDTHYLRDVHLIPMATHFRLWDQQDHVQIAVLHQRDAHVLASYLGVATHQNATTSMPHARDRSRVNYATSKVLASMNVNRDCTADMIRDLCEIYAIDVVLLKSLGFDSVYCS